MDVGTTVFLVLFTLRCGDSYSLWWFDTEVETTSWNPLNQTSEQRLRPGVTKGNSEVNNRFHGKPFLDEVADENPEPVSPGSSTALPPRVLPGGATRGSSSSSGVPSSSEDLSAATRAGTGQPTSTADPPRPTATVSPSTERWGSSLSTVAVDPTRPDCTVTCLDTRFQLLLSQRQLTAAEHAAAKLECGLKQPPPNSQALIRLAFHWVFQSRNGNNCSLAQAHHSSRCTINGSLASSPGNSTHNSVLTLHSLETHHTGTYTCRATLFCCNDSQTLQLEETVILNVYAAPDYFLDILILCVIIAALSLLTAVFSLLQFRRERSRGRKEADKTVYSPVRMTEPQSGAEEMEMERKEKRDRKGSESSSASFDFDED